MPMRPASLTRRALARCAPSALAALLGALLCLTSPAFATPPSSARPVPTSLADAFQRGVGWSVGVYTIIISRILLILCSTDLS